MNCLNQQYFKNELNVGWSTVPQCYHLIGWWRGSVVRTSVSGRRTFPVLRSTCSWWVATNVCKPSATGQPTKANSAFLPFWVDKWVVSCKWTPATALRTGGDLWWMQRRKGRHGVICRQNCVIHAWALCVLCIVGLLMALYKYSSFPFLSFSFQWF